MKRIFLCLVTATYCLVAPSPSDARASRSKTVESIGNFTQDAGNKNVKRTRLNNSEFRTDDGVLTYSTGNVQVRLERVSDGAKTGTAVYLSLTAHAEARSAWTAVQQEPIRVQLFNENGPVGPVMFFEWNAPGTKAGSSLMRCRGKYDVSKQTFINDQNIFDSAQKARILDIYTDAVEC